MWKGKNPDFVNEQGFEWYIDQSLTNLANRKTLTQSGLNMKVFTVVENNEPITRVLVAKGGKMVYENSSLEAMASKIEWLKLAKNQRKF